jgi:hypothetical protein
MRPTPRLSRAMAKSFPTTTAIKVQKHIDMYRGWRDDPKKPTDWESNWRFFQKAIRIAINDRHRR